MVNNYMKICNECNIEKENCEFYSGFNKCKLCIKEIRKEYYIRNSNKIKERVSKYQKENREACNEGYRERRKRNPDVYKKISKRYYDSHREQKLAYARKHRERNPEAYKTYCRNRRAWRKKLKEDYNKEDAKYTHAIFNNKCACCGSTENLEIDHHNPLSKGNVLTRKNAVLLCRSCNAKKQAKPPEEFYLKETLEKINDILFS